ncbi:MAG: hypothetical protein JXB62_20360 [Pirellulales bacterium]|nr:hypothetical protein [Pirellulales bacterium]
MNKTHIEHFKALPQRGGETWQGGLFRMSGRVSGEGPEAFHPYLPIWVAVDSGKVHLADPLLPEEATPSAAVAALLDFALRNERGGYRPGRVEVADEELASQLGFLGEAGVQLAVVGRMETLERFVEDLERNLAGATSPDVPGPLDGKGVTVDKMRQFAEAAAAFYRAAPWQYLTDEDLLQVESPRPPRGMECAVVLGAGRSAYGLGFYQNVDHYAQYRRAADRGGRGVPGVWQVSFDAIAELPPADADLWQDHDLPVASDLAYPMAVWLASRGKLKRPSASELAFLEGLLRAFSQTSEAEIDSGRWQREVPTSGGSLTFALALPDLLKPPTHRQWMERGFEPDRRSNERIFADMNRYFCEHPPESIEEMNEAAASLFSGRKIDDPVTQPETALEQAQDLCYQAFDTHGRRRVQLAREAMKTCPDCADAYVILAERAATPEAELEYYGQAVAAGERALGPAAFEENAGHFWGVSSTRPYMRARFGLATALEGCGRVDEAITHCQELLRLNPNDNQGVRYSLMPTLLASNRDVEAARLLKDYDEESANWVYARALLAFRLSGKSKAARREFREAFRTNPHVPEFLLEEAHGPLPPHYRPASPEEAMICAEELRPAFARTEGALDWIAAEHRQRERELGARRKEQRKRQRQQQKKRKRR